MVHIASVARPRQKAALSGHVSLAKYHGGMSRHVSRWSAAVLLCFCGVLSGCRKSTEAIPKTTKEFQVKGKIIATDPEHAEITLQHEAIPGFMEAMTMPYKVGRKEIVNELHPGDIIHARLLADQTQDGDYTSAKLDEIAVIAEAKPNYKPTSTYHAPIPGDVLPDFALIDQDGKPVHTAQFKGKALLITFIYTRCPLDDFCPKMSRNFAAISKSLAADRALYDSTHLLSISFDPTFDKPEVLRAYGKTYTGTEGFGHWQFTAPTATSLPAVEKYFNVGVTAESDGSLTHSLSTLLIDPAGKVAAWYPGSEWKPEEVVQKIRSMPRG
jgi:protein SCO1/2